MDYLKSLEQASKQMAWESLYYEKNSEKNSDQKAQLTFETYTVSEQSFWLQIN